MSKVDSYLSNYGFFAFSVGNFYAALHSHHLVFVNFFWKSMTVKVKDTSIML